MARRTMLRLVALLLLLACSAMVIFPGGIAAEKLYTKTFRSPGFSQGPGDVIDKFYAVEMPKGHIAIRSFDAEVVAEDGTPIPLHQTYLHHWLLVPFYIPKGADAGEGQRLGIMVPNSGVCGHGQLPQLFGLGSETRRTNTSVPNPYGVVVGDPKSVPKGFEEIWILNVHAIDTRGAVDVRGCTECRCNLYNVSEDEAMGHKPIPAGYEGGRRCCRDGMHCAVRPDFALQGNYYNGKRELFMEYTVTWVDMSDTVVPVKVYILDVTHQRTALNDEDESHECQVEYTVDKCAEGAATFIHTKESAAFLPDGGDLIYGVAHQHMGGVGSILHNEDGEEICSSFPIYGDGREAANEAGYIVGMTTCHPEPGSVKVRAGEKLRLTSWYNNDDQHTGVMGLFYLLVAEPQSPPHKYNFHTNMILVAVTILATFVFIGLTISRHIKNRRGRPEYQLVV